MEKLIEKDALGFIYSEGLFLLREERAGQIIEAPVQDTVSVQAATVAPNIEKTKETPAIGFIPPAPSSGIPSRAERLLGGVATPPQAQPKSTPNAQSPFKWLGNPMGDIAIFASGADADSLAFAKTVFSNAMIDVWKRIRYTDQDFPEAEEVLALLEESGVKYLFVFGGGSPSEWYKPSESFGLNRVRAHSLKELKETPVAKKQLWACLQSWFLNK